VLVLSFTYTVFKGLIAGTWTELVGRDLRTLGPLWSILFVLDFLDVSVMSWWNKAIMQVGQMLYAMLEVCC